MATKDLELPGLGIRDPAAKAWFDTVKAAGVTLGQRVICRNIAARKWDEQAPDEEAGVTIGQVVIALSEEILRANSSNLPAATLANALKALADRDWKAFFEAIMPLIKMLLEMLLPLILGL